MRIGYLLVLFISQALYGQIENCQPMYVWTTEIGILELREKLQDRIADQIESSLVDYKNCSILNRRTHDIERHKNNEKIIRSVNDLDPSTVNGLKTIQANWVLLSSLTLETNGADSIYTLSISIEDLRTTQIIKKSEAYLSINEILRPGQRFFVINKLLERMLGKKSETIKTDRKRDAMDMKLAVSITRSIAIRYVNTKNQSVWIDGEKNWNLGDKAILNKEYESAINFLKEALTIYQTIYVDGNQILNEEATLPRETLSKNGIPWAAKSFAEALRNGDLGTIELFLQGGFPPNAVHEGAAVIFYGLIPQALKPLEVLKLLNRYNFDFNQYLYDEKLITDLSRSGKGRPSLPEYFTSQNLPKQYSTGRSFHGPLVLWIAQLAAWHGDRNQELAMLNYLKEIDVETSLLIEFLYSSARYWGAQSAWDAINIFKEELDAFHASLFSKEMILEAREYWPKYTSYDDSEYLIFGNVNDTLFLTTPDQQFLRVEAEKTDFILKAKENYLSYSKKSHIFEEISLTNVLSSKVRESQSYIVFFYKPGCEECINMLDLFKKMSSIAYTKGIIPILVVHSFETDGASLNEKFRLIWDWGAICSLYRRTDAPFLDFWFHTGLREGINTVQMDNYGKTIRLFSNTTDLHKFFYDW